jgi:hypothetical protein
MDTIQMSTKQLRLSDPDHIKKRIKSFLGKKINIVMADNTAMFGILKEVTETEILLVNMRLKRRSYPLNTIVEVYLDTVV